MTDTQDDLTAMSRTEDADECNPHGMERPYVPASLGGGGYVRKANGTIADVLTNTGRLHWHVNPGDENVTITVGQDLYLLSVADLKAVL